MAKGGNRAQSGAAILMNRNRHKAALPSALVLILLITLGACATRPRLVSVERPVEIEPPKIEEVIREPEPENAAIEDDFEQPLRVVKQNSGLIRKYIEGTADVISGSGLANAKDILVKGEFFFNGKFFRVSYDLAEAVPQGGKLFNVPFLLENLSDDVSRRDALVWNPAPNDSALLLSFDDDYWRSWLDLINIFDKYGAKVTFFVQGSLDPNFKTASSIRNFCHEAVSRGHDLGYHSVNHLNLNNVSIRVFNREVIRGAGTFSSAGISFSAFAYPFGFSRLWMRKTLATIFPLTRGYGRNIRIYTSETMKDGYLTSKAIDNIIYPDNQEFENEIRLILMAAKFTGGSIVPFTTHEFSDTAQWGIKPSRLEFLLKTANELNMQFYTYKDIRRICNI
ncbi:MAG: polysaccharide deacetylase family protein [Treponema sp.]|nr:polysaccharide deacetylase family protein [Treponema sp.]